MPTKVNGETPGFNDPYLHDIILVDQLPSDSWCEGIAVRPSGNILTTRVDEPELIAIDSASAEPLENEYDSIAPKLVHRFPNANGCFNVLPLMGTKREEYAVISGKADLANASFSDWAVSRVIMPPEDSNEAAEISKIADVPDASFVVGMHQVSDRILAIADSNPGSIRRVDIQTGQVSVLLEDETMQPSGADEEGFFGINRVRFTGKYGWFTNTGAGKLFRFPVEYTNGGSDVKSSGPVEEVASGLQNADGLVVDRDGSAAYVCSYTKGHLWRVDVDETAVGGKGTVSTLRKDLVTPTSMDLVYSRDLEKPTLYIVCCGCMSETALEGDRANWLDLARVDREKIHITVTVTTEVTYEYI